MKSINYFGKVIDSWLILYQFCTTLKRSFLLCFKTSDIHVLHFFILFILSFRQILKNTKLINHNRDGENLFYGYFFMFFMCPLSSANIFFLTTTKVLKRLISYILRFLAIIFWYFIMFGTSLRCDVIFTTFSSFDKNTSLVIHHDVRMKPGVIQTLL